MDHSRNKFFRECAHDGAQHHGGYPPSNPSPASSEDRQLPIVASTEAGPNAPVSGSTARASTATPSKAERMSRKSQTAGTHKRRSREGPQIAKTRMVDGPKVPRSDWESFKSGLVLALQKRLSTMSTKQSSP